MTTLEKIRAEIAEIAPLDYPCNKRTPEHIRDMALEIIDKYAEQEPSEIWSIKDVTDAFERYGLIKEQEPCDAVSRQLKIGDEIYIRANVNEIRNDYIICENKGGYFGTVREEIYPSVQPKRNEQ